MQKRPVEKQQPNTDPTDPASAAPNAEKLPTKEQIDDSRRDTDRKQEVSDEPSPPRTDSRRPEEKGTGRR